MTGMWSDSEPTCEYCKDAVSEMTRDGNGNPKRVWCPECSGGGSVTYIRRNTAPEHEAATENLTWAKAWVSSQLKEK